MTGRDWKAQLAEAKRKLGFVVSSAPPTPPPPLKRQRVASRLRPRGTTSEVGTSDRESVPHAQPLREQRQAGAGDASSRDDAIAVAVIAEWAPRVRHRQFVARLGLPYRGSVQTQLERGRKDVCYRCHETVDSVRDALCSVCTLRNIICPNCGACGCGYDDPSSFSTTDLPESFGDDPALWFVHEQDRVVFPPRLGFSEQPNQERQAAYALYLETPTWRAKRNGALKNSWHRCERCDSGSHLQVHHRTYERVGGDELPQDLEVLCAACHYKHHFFAKVYAEYVAGIAPT